MSRPLTDELQLIQREVTSQAARDALWAVGADLARLRRIEAAARALADRLPPQGAATPHTPLVLGEYGTALLYTLREALAGPKAG